MRKPIVIASLICMACLGTTAYAQSSAGGFSGPSAVSSQGGFVGPSTANNVTTVEQAKNLRDDARVVMRGNIVQHLGGDNYLFKDATGTITVDIDAHKWDGQTVKPEDQVEIRGEVDKDWNSIEIDVKSIRIIQ
ncbi:YgiW/YdeI family stress tolerance OB fold protein [Saezia sanguinis]|uniref:YgiW/YdeI family stress tolerance OB fold protein n=1 Tax=Saezia sanguinis TaxID=1965230 RepID=UPI003021EC87